LAGRRSLRQILAESLKAEELAKLTGSYDIVGDIAVIKVHPDLLGRAQVIGDAVMEIHKHVKTVLRQVDGVAGELRLRKLEWVCGEKKTLTVHREFGCLYKVDLAKVYFSPRLQHERARISGLVQPGEVVLNMFAGVGCFSIMIARNSKAAKIYSVDLNPDCVRLMAENARLNQVEDRIVPIQGDAKDVVDSGGVPSVDRVLLPLPGKAIEHLGSAVKCLKESGWIHLYEFTHARKEEDPVDLIENKLRSRLRDLGLSLVSSWVRVVRSVGPNWYQVVVDVQIQKG